MRLKISEKARDDMAEQLRQIRERIAFVEGQHSRACRISRTPARPTSKLFHWVPLEELPHQIVGRDVFRGLPEEIDQRLPARPGMAAALDRDQNDFRPILDPGPKVSCG